MRSRTEIKGQLMTQMQLYLLKTEGVQCPIFLKKKKSSDNNSAATQNSGMKPKKQDSVHITFFLFVDWEQGRSMTLGVKYQMLLMLFIQMDLGKEQSILNPLLWIFIF